MPLSPKFSRERLRNLQNIAGPATTAVLVVLTVLLITSVVWLLATGGPWEQALQKKLARKTELNWQQYRQLGIGWGVVGLTGMLIFVLGCARWWIKPCRSVLSDQPRPRRPQMARRLYILALLVAAGAAWFLRSPRLTHSFTNDEEMAFRKYVWGETQVLKDGSLQHTPVGWGQAIFENEKANNQVGSTIETRLGLALFNKPDAGSPPGVPAFQESAARTFPLLSAALSVMAVGWLGWLLGAPRVGLAAALLLALSPWHLRYSVEIRGYSTMLLTMLLALGSLLRALETGRWRWWLGFALAQAWYLLCFAGSIWVAVAMNVVALIAIWRLQRDSLANALRLVVANVFSAIPLVLLLIPSLLQILAYVADPKNQQGNIPVDGEWMLDYWSHLTTGLMWNADIALSNGITVASLAETSTGLKPILTWLIPLWLALGLGVMLLRDWRARLIAAPLLLGAIIAAVHAKISSGPFLSWYLLYTLPLFCLALPYVAMLAPRRLQLLPFIAVGVFFMVTQAPRNRLSSAPRQPMREAAQWARNEKTTIVGADARATTAVFSTSADQIHTYDPRAIVLKSTEQLTTLMETARQEQRPLAVYFCDRKPGKKADLCRDLRSMLEDTGNFKLEQRLPGLEEMTTYEVYLLNNLHEDGHKLQQRKVP
jgi:hypothetical protein